MTRKTLRKLWAGLFIKEQKNEARAEGLGLSAQVDPLTVGLRIDFAVPLGAGKQVAASQFVWVSPTGCTRSLRALGVLLLPN